MQTLVASVLLRQIHYHVFKFLSEFSLSCVFFMCKTYVCHHFSAHFHQLLNEGVPMPIQTGAQVPFLIITYATIGNMYFMCTCACVGLVKYKGGSS